MQLYCDLWGRQINFTNWKTLVSRPVSRVTLACVSFHFHFPLFLHAFFSSFLSFLKKIKRNASTKNKLGKLKKGKKNGKKQKIKKQENLKIRKIKKPHTPSHTLPPPPSKKTDRLPRGTPCRQIASDERTLCGRFSTPRIAPEVTFRSNWQSQQQQQQPLFGSAFSGSRKLDAVGTEKRDVEGNPTEDPGSSSLEIWSGILFHL